MSSSRELGLDCRVPTLLEQLFAAGRRAGHGSESPAALVELLPSQATASHP